MAKVRSSVLFSFENHLVLIVLGEEDLVLFEELQEHGELLGGIGWQIERLKHRSCGWCQLGRSRLVVLHERHLDGAHRLLELGIFLFSAFVNVALLGVGELAVVEAVVDLWPDPHHWTAFGFGISWAFCFCLSLSNTVYTNSLIFFNVADCGPIVICPRRVPIRALSVPSRRELG